MSISFFHITAHTKSAEVIVESVRKHHPKDFYFLGVDGEHDIAEFAKNNDCHYKKFTPIGPPIYPQGWNLDRSLEFLDRFYTTCQLSKTSHIIMMEDDVLILKPITVNPEWEHACADTKIGNVIPEPVHDLIEQHCGKRPTFKQYGAGGGSIFKVKTFIDHYDTNIEWFKKHFDEIQSYYPTIGYLDCFMNVYYFLAGKNYSVNYRRADTHNHKAGFDYEKFINNLPNDVEILNNYKKYYFKTNDEVITFNTEQLL
jgi:hypothetical protein